MKIDNTNTSLLSFQDPKSARKDKLSGRNKESSIVSDSVALVSQESGVRESSLTSHDEALNMARSIDYGKAVGAHLISGDVSARLINLI